jgi:hypothetical protein
MDLENKMTTNIFETATREKFRFPSTKGELTTEQLWALPLESRSNASLDDTAKRVNAELKAVTEESFVATTTNPAKKLLETKLEVVKHIIAVRLAENEAARTKMANKAEAEKLKEILDMKKTMALQNLSEEEINARLAALGS